MKFVREPFPDVDNDKIMRWILKWGSIQGALLNDWAIDKKDERLVSLQRAIRAAYSKWKEPACKPFDWSKV